MRVLTAHQPVYLPWLGLLHKIALADVYVFLDTVKYLKQDWNNRNKIKTPQGAHMLTVPVATGGSDNVLLKDVPIAIQEGWQRKHWLTLRNNYSRAPYFSEHRAFFEEVYCSRRWERLIDLNREILKYLLGAFQIETEFVDASAHDFSGTKNDLLIDICTKLQADVYLFGALGRDYADAKKFAECGIRIRFQSFTHPTYEQLFGPFTSHTAAIDLLFNHGSAARDVIMTGQNSLDTGSVLE